MTDTAQGKGENGIYVCSHEEVGLPINYLGIIRRNMDKILREKPPKKTNKKKPKP